MDWTVPPCVTRRSHKCHRGELFTGEETYGTPVLSSAPAQHAMERSKVNKINWKTVPHIYDRNAEVCSKTTVTASLVYNLLKSAI